MSNPTVPSESTVTEKAVEAACEAVLVQCDNDAVSDEKIVRVALAAAVPYLFVALADEIRLQVETRQQQTAEAERSGSRLIARDFAAQTSGLLTAEDLVRSAAGRWGA